MQTAEIKFFEIEIELKYSEDTKKRYGLIIM